jgi:hypothetical protein
MKKVFVLLITLGFILNNARPDDAATKNKKPSIQPIKVTAGSTSADAFSVFKMSNGRISASGINDSVDANKARYFLGAVDWRKAPTAPSNGVAGYDYNPLIYETGDKPWEFGKFVQANFYTSGKRAVGPDYSVDTSTRLYEFDVKFPEFKLPKGKMVAADFQTERSGDGMLQRGVTYAKNTTEPGSRIYFLGDHWLHEVGCPQAYSVSAEAFQEWLRSTSADTILESFQRNIKPYSNYGYIMLNWEAVMYDVPNDQRYKLVNCLKWYSEQNYQARLSAWMQAGFTTSRASFEGDFNYADYAGISSFSGTESEFRAKYKKFGGQPDYAQYLDVGLIGGYQNYVTEDGVIHHYLLEYLVNKKYYPDKLAIASIWHDLEAINWQLMPMTPPGADYQYFNKAAVLNQSMYNWGVWTVAVGDGYHSWSDPIQWTDRMTDYPPGSTTFSGQPLQMVAGKMYARNNLKNIDWLQRGVWEVSQHADIIDAKSAWIFPVSVEDSYAKKTPLIAYKLSRDGSAALVLALDMWGGEGSHKIDFPNSPLGFKNRKIVVNGTFTTVQQIKLANAY